MIVTGFYLSFPANAARLENWPRPKQLRQRVHIVKELSKPDLETAFNVPFQPRQVTIRFLCKFSASKSGLLD
ncbi:hypothetical protein [Cohaesibacter marisflavi]|uniref:hypothetical protein n=1 Tax=Cohaesibacter marisflavi TaxID=655353 RepID=UPI0029C903DF|nr:hypothetical protein [Cohaesibacter marisflavi]